MSLIRCSILRLNRINVQSIRGHNKFIKLHKELSSPFVISRRYLSNQDEVKTLFKDKVKLNDTSADEIDLTKLDLTKFHDSEAASNLVGLSNETIENTDNFKQVLSNLINKTDGTTENLENLNQILSATDIGLSAYLPPRLFYDLITYLHDSTTLTWITSILISCIALRILTFPLYVKAKRQSAELSNNMIKMQSNMVKLDFNSPDAENLKNSEEAMKSVKKLNESLPKFFLSPMAQALVFSSFYFCLRAMANHPIQSMKSESFLWVPSLTAADPYFLFPILTATTTFLMLKYNMETPIQSGPQAKIFKYMTVGLPMIIFAVTCTFPANLTIYWFINNNITVLAHYLTKHPKAKAYFKIPEMTQVADPKEFEKFGETFKHGLSQVNEMFKLEEKQELIKKKEEQLIKKKRIKYITPKKNEE